MIIFFIMMAALSATFAMINANELITPRPGAVTLSVNTTSVNNFIQTFVPIMAYYSLQNHTVDLNFVD